VAPSLNYITQIEMTMSIRTLLVATALSVSCVSTSAQEVGDPTFNGFAKLVHCNIGTVVACLGEACAVISAGGIGPDMNIWISLSEKRAAPSSNYKARDSVPITVQDVSPAAMNSDLYVKFNFSGIPQDGPNSLGLLFYHPRSNGTYAILFGQTTTLPPDPGSPTKVTKLIRGGTCDLQN